MAFWMWQVPRGSAEQGPLGLKSETVQGREEGPGDPWPGTESGNGLNRRAWTTGEVTRGQRVARVMLSRDSRGAQPARASRPGEGWPLCRGPPESLEGNGGRPRAAHLCALATCGPSM